MSTQELEVQKKTFLSKCSSHMTGKNILMGVLILLAFLFYIDQSLEWFLAKQLSSLNWCIESSTSKHHAYYFNQRGIAYYRYGYFREAASDFQASYRIRPEWTSVYNLALATSHYRPSLAETFFDEADRLRGERLDRRVSEPYETIDGPSADAWMQGDTPPSHAATLSSPELTSAAHNPASVSNGGLPMK